MRRSLRQLSAPLLLLCALTCVMAWSPTAANAQTYTQLQVLLPGETPAPGTASGKLGAPDTQTGGFPFTVRIRACDDSWNTVPSVGDVVSFFSSDPAANLPGPIALINGETTVTVLLNSGGTLTIGARDDSDPGITPAVSAPVYVVALHHFDFSSFNRHHVAGERFWVSIRAENANGSRAEGFNGPVRLRQLTSYGEGRVSPEVITFSNGRWSGNVTVYRADETNGYYGNVTLLAYLDNNPAVSGSSNRFHVHPNDYDRLQIIVPGQTRVPGSISGFVGRPGSQSAGQPFAAQVYATDEYWNEVSDFNNDAPPVDRALPNISDRVRITSTDPAANTPVTGRLSNGRATFSVILATVGTQFLTVSNDSRGSIDGMTTMGIPVIGTGADHFEIDPVASPVTAGVPVPVRIRAADGSGNTITNFNGDAIVVASTGAGSISPSAITFQNGIYTGDITFRGAGTEITFTCFDYSSPPHFGTSNAFDVNAGPYVGLQVLLPGQEPKGGTSSGYVGAPLTQSAGTGFNIVVRAVDEFWNRVGGVGDRVSLTSTDAWADMPQDTALVNGELVIPVTHYRADVHMITAANLDTPSIDSHTSSAFEVVAGDYARILLLAPGEEIAFGTPSGRGGSATDQSINFAFPVHVYATDQWWNPVTGVSDVIRITTTDPLAELPPDAALVDGEVTMNVRLSTGGFTQILASNMSQPAMAQSVTQVRAISTGFHLEATVSPVFVQAGEQFTLDVRVLNDAGSVIYEINSMINIEVRHASSGDPGRGQLFASTFQLLSGERTIAQTYSYAEPIVLVIRDDAGNDPAVTEVITVSPGPPAAVTLTSDPSWLGGNQHATLTARVVDAFDNGVEGEPVDFEIASGSGTLGTADPVTDTEGAARADFQSSRFNGMTRIRATSNTFSTVLDIETALVDPELPGGEVTNYPNPFHPDEGPTTIAYKLDDAATVTMSLYTLTGQRVRTETFPAGTQGGRAGLNEFLWDGNNGAGSDVASGGYIVVIKAEATGQTLHVMRRRIALIR